MVDRICDNLFDGGTLEIASAAAGVPFDVLDKWMLQAVEDKKAGSSTPYTFLASSIEQARAQGAMRFFRVLAAESDAGGARAATELLKPVMKAPPKDGGKKTSDGSAEVRQMVQQALELETEGDDG